MIYYTKFRKSPKLDNTIWVLGCSHIWGQSLEEHDTVPYLLENLTGQPVDNLGIIGASPDLVYYVLNDLLKSHNPRAIIIAWPESGRTYHVNNNNTITTIGPWSINSNIDKKILEQYKTDILNGTILKNNLKCMDQVNQIVNCPYLSFRYLKNVKEIINNNNKFLDFAPDGKHPGPQTTRVIANAMSEWINTIIWQGYQDSNLS